MNTESHSDQILPGTTSQPRSVQAAWPPAQQVYSIPLGAAGVDRVQVAAGRDELRDAGAKQAHGYKHLHHTHQMIAAAEAARGLQINTERCSTHATEASTWQQQCRTAEPAEAGAIL